MDYTKIRKIIANCCADTGKPNDPIFRVNMMKLAKLVQPYGYIPLIYKNNFISKMAEPEDIPLLSEYFKEDKLTWFDDRKSFLNIIFIREEDIDDKLENLLADCVLSRERETQPPKIPCNVKPKEKEKDYHCLTCPHNKDRLKIDMVKTLAVIVGNYPCYIALVAKYVKRDAILMNIRIRANSILLSSSDNKEDNNPPSTEDPTTPTEPVDPPRDDNTDQVEKENNEEV